MVVAHEPSMYCSIVDVLTKYSKQDYIAVVIISPICLWFFVGGQLI